MPTDEFGQPENQTQIPANSLGEFEDLSTTRRKLNAQTASNAALELEHLKKLLSSQEASRQQAQSMAAEAHKQLKLLEHENTRIRGDLKRSQDQLSSAKAEHANELRRAADRESSIRTELIESRGQAAKAIDTASGYRKRGLAISVTLAVVLSSLTWLAMNYWHSTDVQGKTRDESPASASVADASVPDRMPPNPVPPKPDPATPHDFTGSLSRLDSALGAFSGQKPEDVLRRVHLANAAKGISVCSFEWNNGEPSLQFGEKVGTELGSAMTECAEAVEKTATSEKSAKK
jgi:hypothetical protein